jgi:hypothetical protein
MAATQHLSGIDAVGIQLLHLRVENLAAAPGSPYGAGHSYYDTALGAVRYYDGTVWRTPVARGDHTGTQLAATISDFQTTVRSNTLNQFATPTANIPMGGFTLTGLGTPSANGQAATYDWVIGQVQASAAGIASKPPVNAVATTNLGRSGLAAIDGYTPVAGDRILLTAQTTASQNGVYNAASGAWTRTTVDGAGAGEIEPGAMWLVVSGTTYAGTQWRVSTTGTITIDSTNLTIVQFGAGSTYTAGNGITLTGSAFSVNPAASGGITVGAGGVSVDTTIVARKFAANIGDGTTTAIVVTHNLNTQDIVTSVRIGTSGAAVEVDWAPTTVNTATFTFATAPTSNQYRVVVMG